MSLGNPVGEFEFESKGVTVTESSSGGGGTLEVNYEGVATGYGVVATTMKFTVEAAGDKSGTVSSLSVAWLENGDSMSGQASGVFSESGVNTWRVRSFLVSLMAQFYCLTVKSPWQSAPTKARCTFGNRHPVVAIGASGSGKSGNQEIIASSY